MKRYLQISILGVFSFVSPAAADNSITFGLTTTQEASGVSQEIRTGLAGAFPELDISYSVAGTSQQLRSLEEGFIPFAVTHNIDREKMLVSKGGFGRAELFANDFLLVGPEDPDLACTSMSTCLTEIASDSHPFLSRGDNSGTHIYEMASWNISELDPMLLPEYMIASGGAANSLRICRIQRCFMIIDESSFTSRPQNGLVEVVRDKGANVYSLVYSLQFSTSQNADVIQWLIAEVPALSEKFGYTRK